MYTDDTQLYLDFSPEDEDSAHANIAECVKEIKAWLSDNFLLLNENKTEAITVIPVNQLAVAKSIQLGDVTISYVTVVTLHNAPVGVIKKLERVQRSSARIVYMTSTQISTDFHDENTPRPSLATSIIEDNTQIVDCNI